MIFKFKQTKPKYVQPTYQPSPRDKTLAESNKTFKERLFTSLSYRRRISHLPPKKLISEVEKQFASAKCISFSVNKTFKNKKSSVNKCLFMCTLSDSGDSQIAKPELLTCCCCNIKPPSCTVLLAKACKRSFSENKYFPVNVIKDT